MVGASNARSIPGPIASNVTTMSSPSYSSSARKARLARYEKRPSDAMCYGEAWLWELTNSGSTPSLVGGGWEGMREAVDLYEVLGVRRSATLGEIRRAYQKRARQLHPDLNPGDPAAAERFRAVSRAFEVLADPERRAEYDLHGNLSSPSAAPDTGFEGFDFSAEVRGGGLNFREIFEGVLRP